MDNTAPISRELNQRCCEIADRVVPQYRNGKRNYDCSGTIGKRWGAAFEGAMLALSEHSGGAAGAPIR